MKEIACHMAHNSLLFDTCNIPFCFSQRTPHFVHIIFEFSFVTAHHQQQTQTIRSCQKRWKLFCTLNPTVHHLFSATQQQFKHKFNAYVKCIEPNGRVQNAVMLSSVTSCTMWNHLNSFDHFWHSTFYRICTVFRFENGNCWPIYKSKSGQHVIGLHSLGKNWAICVSIFSRSCALAHSFVPTIDC